MVLELKCSEKELKEVASGKKKTISREVRPNNERKFCLVNDAEEITGLIEYDSLLLSCKKLNASLTVEVNEIRLLEYEDENGDLVFYDYKGEQHQMIDIDYDLGAILQRSGNIPNV